MRSQRSIALVTLGGSGPSGEREAMNFGVVPNVDGERGVKIKTLDRRSVRLCESEGAQLARKDAGVGGIAHVSFDHDSG